MNAMSPSVTRFGFLQFRGEASPRIFRAADGAGETETFELTTDRLAVTFHGGGRIVFDSTRISDWGLFCNPVSNADQSLTLH